MPERARLQPGCLLYDRSVISLYPIGIGFLCSSQLIIKLLLTKKLIAFVVAVVVLIIVIVCFTIHAIANIKPRQYRHSQDFTKKEKPVIMEPLRNATEEELYEGGFRTKLVEKDGQLCIEKQHKIIHCGTQ